MTENILKKILLITLLGVIIFGAFYKDFYPIDEWRYVVITQDLNDSFLKLKYAGDDYFEKPPFYFWILCFFANVFGMFNFFSFKLPNIVALIIFVMIFKKYLSCFVKDYILFLLVFFSLPMNIASIQLVRMDFIMNLFINLSILTIFRQLVVNAQQSVSSSNLALNIQHSTFILSGLFSSIAVLIKGPAGFFIPFFVVFTTLVIEKLFKMRYILCFLLGFIPAIFLWFLFGYIYYGTSYIESYILKETAGRIIKGKHHNETVFYYLLFFLPCILPYSLVFFSNIRSIFKSKFKFFLYWVIISIIILSISKSKLIIYLSSIMLPVSIIVYKLFEENNLPDILKSCMKITMLFLSVIFVLTLLFSIFGTSTSHGNYISNAILSTDAKIVLITLVVLSVFLTKAISNWVFLVWWVVTISVVSVFMYNKLNEHYDVKRVINAINAECKNNDIYVYKWKTLYYFKWRMRNNSIKFSIRLPEDKDSCIITSRNIYNGDKLELSIIKTVPFTRDGGIVVFKNKKLEMKK